MAKRRRRRPKRPPAIAWRLTADQRRQVVDRTLGLMKGNDQAASLEAIRLLMQMDEMNVTANFRGTKAFWKAIERIARDGGIYDANGVDEMKDGQDTKRSSRRRTGRPTEPRHVVVVATPCCPECGSTAIETQRSIDNGDGSRTRVSRCKDPACDCHFDVVQETLIQDLDTELSVCVTLPTSTDHEGETMNQQLNILSIGQSASRLTIRVSELQAIAAELGIKPAATINNVDYLNVSDLDKIRDHIAASVRHAETATVLGQRARIQ